MSTARYLIAKFIPDLHRMEPRNIGVVLWTPVGVVARFLKEKQTGEVDGRSVPPWIPSPGIYKQWVKFWQSEIEKQEICPYTGGKAVRNTEPQFLDVLKTSGSGNFVLAEGGLVIDPIEADKLHEAVTFLFNALVDTNEGEEVKDRTLTEVCEEVISKTRLKTNRHFKPQQRVRCKVGERSTDFEFSYYYGNGTPKRLYQRVPLVSGQKEAYVHNAAYMFEKVINDKVIDPSEGGILIYATQEQMQEKVIREAVTILRDITRVFNLVDEQDLVAEFMNLPAIDEDH